MPVLGIEGGPMAEVAVVVVVAVVVADVSSMAYASVRTAYRMKTVTAACGMQHLLEDAHHDEA